MDIIDEASSVPARAWDRPAPQVPVPAPVVGVDVAWSRGLSDERGACLVVEALYRKRDGSTVKATPQVIPQVAIETFKGGLSLFAILDVILAPAIEADRLAHERLGSAAAAIHAAAVKRARKLDVRRLH